MPLFHVQDPDRPMYVVAATYGEAVDRYLRLVADENELPVKDCDLPQGVQFVCDDEDLLLPDGSGSGRRIDRTSFVLDLTQDPHARVAALAYADSCERDGLAPLAEALRTAVAEYVRTDG